MRKNPKVFCLKKMNEGVEEIAANTSRWVLTQQSGANEETRGKEGGVGNKDTENRDGVEEGTRPLVFLPQIPPPC